MLVAPVSLQVALVREAAATLATSKGSLTSMATTLVCSKASPVCKASFAVRTGIRQQSHVPAQMCSQVALITKPSSTLGAGERAPSLGMKSLVGGQVLPPGKRFTTVRAEKWLLFRHLAGTCILLRLGFAHLLDAAVGHLCLCLTEASILPLLGVADARGHELSLPRLVHARKSAHFLLRRRLKKKRALIRFRVHQASGENLSQLSATSVRDGALFQLTIVSAGGYGLPYGTVLPAATHLLPWAWGVSMGLCDLPGFGRILEWRCSFIMQSLVAQQMPAMYEAPGAEGTGVRAFPGVGELVPHQMCLLAETLGAAVTREGPLSRVHTLVRTQVDLLRKAAATVGAGERTFSGVHASMPGQVGLFAKGLAALGAGKGAGMGIPLAGHEWGSRVLTPGAAQRLLLAQHLPLLQSQARELTEAPAGVVHIPWTEAFRLTDTPNGQSREQHLRTQSTRPLGVVVCFHFHSPDQPLACWSNGTGRRQVLRWMHRRRVESYGAVTYLPTMERDSTFPHSTPRSASPALVRACPATELFPGVGHLRSCECLAETQRITVSVVGLQVGKPL